MPERKRPAARKKLARRRDDDPVKIFKDGRVAWWPSGIPGVGERKMKRKKIGEDAAEPGHRRRGPPRSASTCSWTSLVRHEA